MLLEHLDVVDPDASDAPRGTLIDALIDALIDRLAARLVAAGRVIPGISIEDGRARSWWWPLPSAADRADIATLCQDATVESQRAAAAAIANAVDALVRAKLVEHGVSFVAARGGPITFRATKC